MTMNFKYPLIIFLIFICLVTGAPDQHEAGIVTDRLGRKVYMPADPRRVIALAPSVTEIIFALKQEKRLKGVTRFSDFPEEAAKYPKVGSYVHLDLEKIVSLKPDCCIAIKDGNPKKVIDKLESLKIPVYAVDPRSLDSVMETFLEIGMLLDAEKKAKNLVQSMRSRIENVKSRVAKSLKRPRVFFQIGISPTVSAGTGTFIHQLIILAGGENLAKGPRPYPRYSQEQVLAFSPEVFIITSMARGKIFENVKAKWSRWSDMPAVKNNRIYIVDSNLFDRPTPRLVDGLELLARLIHPELFQEEAP